MDIPKTDPGVASWWKRLAGAPGHSRATGVGATMGTGSRDSPVAAESAIKRILVPTDFSPSSVRALETAVLLARRYHAAITLLYVVDVNFHVPPTGPVDANKLREELWQEGLGKLGQMVLGLRGAGVDVQTLIRQGLPWEEIVEAAQQYDLLVIGKHKAGPFWRLFSRNTLKGVIGAAPCPVMVVNPKPEIRIPKRRRHHPAPAQ